MMLPKQIVVIHLTTESHIIKAVSLDLRVVHLYQVMWNHKLIMKTAVHSLKHLSPHVIHNKHLDMEKGNHPPPPHSIKTHVTTLNQKHFSMI